MDNRIRHQLKRSILLWSPKSTFERRGNREKDEKSKKINGKTERKERKRKKKEKRKKKVRRKKKGERRKERRVFLLIRIETYFFSFIDNFSLFFPL